MADLPPRIRLVVIFGGRSAEHDISCISASHVLAALDPDRYEVVPIGITRAGQFVLAKQNAELGDTASLSAVGKDIEPLPLLKPANAPVEQTPTVVFPVLHGPNGEDGTVQGLLETAGLPYVGTGVLGSAVAMDKAMAKTVLGAHGIAQVPWRVLQRHEDLDALDLEGILAELGPTLFVKPANMGSSIGVSRIAAADGPNALLSATHEALRYDDVVILEHGIEGRELECAVLGNHEPRASTIGEIVAGAEFYDYSDKYFDGNARTEIPADLESATAEAAQAMALEAFSALRCEGMARVDMFLTDAGDLLVNEVNTIPGFTPISMYPKLWQATGLPYRDLIDELVRLALARHATRAARAVSPT